MKTKDQIDIAKEKRYCRKPCHIHKRRIHQLHHMLCCKLLRCHGYEFMIKKQKEYNEKIKKLN